MKIISVLGTPCLTLRWNADCPVTLRENSGASVLLGNNVECIRNEYCRTLVLDRKPVLSELWDGHIAERCLETIMKL